MIEVYGIITGVAVAWAWIVTGLLIGEHKADLQGALEREREHSADLRMQLMARTPGEYAEAKVIAQAWQPDDRPKAAATRIVSDASGLFQVEVPDNDPAD